MMQLPELSDYYYTLDKQSRARYVQKISLFGQRDPYSLKKADFDCGNSYPDFKLVPSLHTNMLLHA